MLIKNGVPIERQIQSFKIFSIDTGLNRATFAAQNVVEVFVEQKVVHLSRINNYLDLGPVLVLFFSPTASVTSRVHTSTRHTRSKVIRYTVPYTVAQGKRPYTARTALTHVLYLHTV